MCNKSFDDAEILDSVTAPILKATLVYFHCWRQIFCGLLLATDAVVLVDMVVISLLCLTVAFNTIDQQVLIDWVEHLVKP